MLPLLLLLLLQPLLLLPGHPRVGWMGLGLIVFQRWGRPLPLRIVIDRSVAMLAVRRRVSAATVA